MLDVSAMLMTVLAGEYSLSMYSSICSRDIAPTDLFVPATSRPSGWSGQSKFIQYHTHQLVRGIFTHADFFNDDLPLFFDILFLKNGVQ